MNDKEFANEIDELIKKVTAKNNINNYEIIEIRTNSKGEGFMGKIFKVNLIDKFTEEIWNLLLKCAFKDGKLRESIPIRKSFENEIYFYSTIFPTLEDFRKSVGGPIEHDLVAKCYQIVLELEMESLVMENLEAKNFQVFDKKLDFTSEHVELIAKTYGYFHALSFAFKDQNFEKYSKIVSQLHNIYKIFLNTHMFKDTLKIAYGEVNKIFVPERDDVLINSFRKYLEFPTEIYEQTTDDGDECSVILHGDCWSNNMLFRYDEKSGKPIDMRLIDWQLAKVGSPVCDLAYAIYTGASKSILDNLDKYLKIYHNTLSSTLRQLGSDPEKLLPYQVFKEQWRIYAKFGLVMGAMVLRMKCTNSEDVTEFHDIDFDSEDNSTVFFKPKYDSKRYERTLYNLVSHLNETDAL